jgi:preprotein translocase subunit SecE
VTQRDTSLSLAGAEKPHPRRSLSSIHTLVLASNMRVLARASAPSIELARPRASSARRVARPRAIVVVARASGEEDEPSTASESAAETSAAAAETSGDDGDTSSSSSSEDIGAAIRAAKEAKADEGANVFAGAAEEVGLIEWPTVGGALSTTALVMGGIFGSAGVLLGVNGVLSELSQKLFP